MKIQLVENWKTLLKSAWSVQLAYAATLIGAIGQVLAYAPTDKLAILFITPGQATYAGGIATALGLLLTVIIPPARTIKQDGLVIPAKVEPKND